QGNDARSASFAERRRTKPALLIDGLVQHRRQLFQIDGDDSGSHHDANPLWVNPVERKVAIGNGQPGRANGKLHGPAHNFQAFPLTILQIRFDVKADDLGGNLGGMLRRVEGANRPHAATTVDAVGPELLFADAVRRYDANAGDDDSSHNVPL